MHKYRQLLGEVLVASFFLQLFALVSPLFFQVVIDKVLVHRGLTHARRAGDRPGRDLAVREPCCGMLRTYLFAHTTNRIDVELGARLFRHLLALPIAYFQARRVGDSVARVRELENIRNFLTSSALTLVIDLFFTFVFLAVMFFYSPLLTWIVLGVVPVLYRASRPARRRCSARRLDEKFQRGAENQAFLVESVTGVETLKAMAVEPQMQRRWEEQLAGYVAASFRVLSLGNYGQPDRPVRQQAGRRRRCCIFGAKLVIDGDLTVGELVAFNMLAGRVSAPVLRLAQLWQDFHQARLSVAAARRHPQHARPSRPTVRRAAALPPIRGDVAFEHVTFRYRIDGPEVLHDVSFTVPAGQVVGIVGPSGSGKSTLAKLVQRLYVPESGRVLVDGVDLAMVDPAWLRRQIGVVLQENVLFNRSVRDNIALADPGDADGAGDRRGQARRRARVHPRTAGRLRHHRRRARRAPVRRPAPAHRHRPRAGHRSAHPDLRRGDQRARLRERAHHPGEHARRSCKGRTVFIIAHRLSTVRHADRIITIDTGRLVEDGTHDELISTGGRYAALHRLQATCRRCP